jgi:hypothetical protein
MIKLRTLSDARLLVQTYTAKSCTPLSNRYSNPTSLAPRHVFHALVGIGMLRSTYHPRSTAVNHCGGRELLGLSSLTAGLGADRAAAIAVLKGVYPGRKASVVLSKFAILLRGCGGRGISGGSHSGWSSRTSGHEVAVTQPVRWWWRTMEGFVVRIITLPEGWWMK